MQTSKETTIPHNACETQVRPVTGEINKSEVLAAQMLKDAFDREFKHVRVLNNLILPTPEGHRVASCEIDVCVVCDGGVFIFEVKPWANCELRSEKSLNPETQAQDRKWILRYQDGGERELNSDPLKQVSGKYRVVSPVAHAVVQAEVAARANAFNSSASLMADEIEDASGLVLETDANGFSVASPVAKPLKAQGFLLLPNDGVSLAPGMNVCVLTKHDLSYLVRRLRNDSRRDQDKGHFCKLDAAMVALVAAELESAGSQITASEHNQNIADVFGPSQPIIVLKPADDLNAEAAHA